MSSKPEPRSNAPTASAAVMKTIEDQLTEERSSKTSLETRAVSVITTSGTLTTLLFALAAIVTKSQTYTLPAGARWLLFASVTAFLVAAVVAILAAKPMSYAEFTVEGLRAIASAAAMTAPASHANEKIACRLVDIIETARQRNKQKATRLTYAVYAEVVGTVLVALAVGVILLVA